MARVSGRRRLSRIEVFWETHQNFRLFVESVHEVIVLWPLRAIRFLLRGIRKEIRTHGLTWAFVVLLGSIVATAIALVMLVGWVRPDSFYIVGGMVWPLATYTTCRFALWAARNLYEKSDSFRDMIDRFWGWVTSRPDAIWAFITSRWVRWTLFVLLITAGVYVVRNYEVRYALWPVVILGPTAVLSAILKGRREKKGVRWAVSRIFPWVTYPIFLFIFTATSFWVAVEPTLDRWATETWLVWPLSFAFGVVLTLILRAWNRIEPEHRLHWSLFFVIVPVASALMRWVGFELVLSQVNLARVLSGAAALWAVLGVFFWRWLIFSHWWTENPLRRMGLVDQKGELLVGIEMPYTEFRLPVSRLAGILQLLFRFHPEAERTEYLPLLDPTAGRSGFGHIALGIQYARGETFDDFADPFRVKDSVVIKTKSKIPLAWWGYVFQNKMRKQLKNPSKDSFPTPLARLLDISHVKFQDADLGPDVVQHLPIRGVGKMWIVQKDARYTGEDAWGRVWLAMVKAAGDQDLLVTTFLQSDARSRWNRQHPEARQGGRRQVPFQ